MPARNIIKKYVAGGYYHIYNRGVEKRDIFLDKQDCIVFQRYLKLYLAHPDEVREIQVPRIQSFLRYNMHHELDLLAFSLMPNHFHLELKQIKEDSIKKLMKRLMTCYVMYFNRKYKRVGPLFQNIYKAALVENDSYLLHLSRYIHLNPSKILHPKIDFSDFSSLPYYLNSKEATWLKTSEILFYFTSSPLKGKGKSYEEFVKNYRVPPNIILVGLTLENEDD
jgi:putative transposase